MNDQYKETLDRIKNWKPARQFDERVRNYVAKLKTPEELQRRGAWRTEFPDDTKPSKWNIAWAWFNGKKSAIGFLITGIGWGLTTITPWGWAVVGIGGLFGSGGLIHKIFKGQSKYGDIGKFGEKEWSQLVADIQSALKVKDYGKLIFIAISLIISIFKKEEKS